MIKRSQLSEATRLSKALSDIDADLASIELSDLPITIHFDDHDVIDIPKDEAIAMLRRERAKLATRFAELGVEDDLP